MSSSKITLMTFARYMNQHEDDLFKNLTVPEGIEKDLLVDNILLRGGEFEVVYSEPTFMQYAIGTWSRKWYRTMQRWISALSIDYAPLENYDRYEEMVDTSGKTSGLVRTMANTDTETINTKDLRTLNTEDKEVRDYSDTININTQDKQTKDLEDKETRDYSDTKNINTQSKETKDLEDKKTLDTQNEMLRNLQDKETRNLKDEETRDLEDEETRDLDDTTTFDHTKTTEQQVSAYDSSSYQPSQLTTESDGVSSGGNLSHNTQKLEQNGTDTFTHTGTDTFEHTGDSTFNHTGTEISTNTGDETTKYTGTDTTNNTGTEKTDYSGIDKFEHTGTDTTNRTGTEKTDYTGSDTTGHTGTDTLDKTGTNEMAHTGTVSDDGTESAHNEHVAHVHGNIGTMTSQKMLSDELEISRWNIYEQITDMFLTEFIIPIYT